MTAATEIEVWRGGVMAWECDEMGHMNTRFYVLRAMEGTAVLFARLGLPGLFAPGSPTTAVPQGLHIRFHREAREAASLWMTGTVTEVGDCWIAVALTLLSAGDGTCMATFRLRLVHRDSSGAAVPWPAAVAGQAAAALAPVPAVAAARSLPDALHAEPQRKGPATGLTRIATGAFGPDRMDAFGRMAPHHFIGAVSDGVRALTAPFRALVVAHAEPAPETVGGAVLETRALFTAWPRAGDCYEIHSGLAGLDRNVMVLAHRMTDLATGQVFGTMESVAVVFDIGRRRIVPVAEAARTELSRFIVPGLRP